MGHERTDYFRQEADRRQYLHDDSHRSGDTSEAFHALATGLAIEGGGDGFEVVKMYSESQSGFRRVHQVMCQRVPMVDGS
jgi:hypothetical protein